MAEQTGSVDTGSVDTGTEVTNPHQAQADLDAWANETPKPKVIPPKGPDGKFRRAGTDTDTKEVARVVKGTVKELARDVPPEQEEEEEQLEEEVEEQPRPKRKVKGIINGQEEEIDLDDEEFQKVNAVQATRAAQKAWREAAQMRKEAQQFREALDAARQQVATNPMALFEALGIPEEQVYQFAKQRTIEKISETIDPNTGQPYTPEQQRIIQLQKELQRREQMEKQQAQQAEAAEMEQMKQVIRQDIDRKFTAALKETGLPPTQYTMMRLADLMQSMGPDVDPVTVAPLVLEDMVNETRQTIYSMPIEVAAEILGEDWLNKLRQWDIQRARAGKDKFGRNPQKYPNNAQQRVPAGRKAGQPLTPSAAQDWLEKWADGGK